MTDVQDEVDTGNENVEHMGTLKETSKDESVNQAIQSTVISNEYSAKTTFIDNEDQNVWPEDSKLASDAEPVSTSVQEEQCITEEKHELPDSTANDFKAAHEEQSITETDPKIKGHENVILRTSKEECTTVDTAFPGSNETDINNVVYEASGHDNQPCLLEVESRDLDNTEHTEISNTEDITFQECNKVKKNELREEGTSEEMLSHNKNDEQSVKQLDVDPGVKNTDTVHKESPSDFPNQFQLPIETKRDETSLDHRMQENYDNIPREPEMHQTVDKTKTISEIVGTDTVDKQKAQSEFSGHHLQFPVKTKDVETSAEHENQANSNNASSTSEMQQTAVKTEAVPEKAGTEASSNVIGSPDVDSSKGDYKVTQNSSQPPPSKKGLLQFEQMSHEDLLKQCKRQLLFLQKTKVKHDDLSRNLLELQNENKILKECSTKTGVSAELLRRLQSENDRLLDEKDSQSEVVSQLNKDISKLVADLARCKEQLEETREKFNQMKESLAAVTSEKKTQDAFVLELQGQIIVLRSERDTDMKKMGEKHSKVEFWEAKCTSVQEELEAKGKECLELQTSFNQLKQELEQEKVMNLEIGDYERTLSDLNAQLAQEAKTKEDLNLQLQKMREGHDVLQKEIEHLEQQCQSEESRSLHLKEVLDSTRHQLASKCEEQEKISSTLAELKQQKEDTLASKEELQYQLSLSASNLLVLEGELKLNREQCEKSDLSLKSRISSLTEELSEARHQLESSRKEFHSYKVRVHSVLKQQKGTGTTSGQPVSNLSVQSEEQKGQMEWTLELCKGKIAQLMEQLSTLTVERDSLQKEQEWLLSKQNLLTQQMQEKEETLIQRSEELRQELDLSRSFWDTEKQQLLQQQKNLVHEYDHRLSSLELEHEKHVCSLVNQVEQLQKSTPLFSPLSVDQAPQRHSHQGQIFDFIPTTQLSPSVDESFDICSQERQEGEGSECTDPLPAPAAFQTLVTSPASGFMPLEHLLQTEHNSNYGNQDPEIIADTINTLQKKVDHISELLNESEASNLRLSEQTRLLKEEIRRLERNTERHEHFNNLEYLKNIVLKFSTTPNGSERERLVPVISTLLQLSPEEQTQMKLVANQDSGNSNDTSGWSNYLHRWSGLV